MTTQRDGRESSYRGKFKRSEKSKREMWKLWEYIGNVEEENGGVDGGGGEEKIEAYLIKVGKH